MFHLGAIKDTRDDRDYLYQTIFRSASLPPMVDYESNMSPVKDQGQRGTCVSFASVAVKEYQEMKQRGFAQVLDLSEEFVYEQVCQPGGGAMPRDAFKLMDKEGVCLEQYMPYLDITDAEEPTFVPENHRRALGNATEFKAKSFVRLAALQDMMQSLFTNGPFLLGVNWLNPWFTPSEMLPNGYPVLRHTTGKSAGGHALCVVGFDTTIQKGKTYFKVRNSWGTSWGHGGYFYFSEDAIDANLNDAWATFDIANPALKSIPSK